MWKSSFWWIVDAVFNWRYVSEAAETSGTRTDWKYFSTFLLVNILKHRGFESGLPRVTHLYKVNMLSQGNSWSFSCLKSENKLKCFLLLYSVVSINESSCTWIELHTWLRSFSTAGESPVCAPVFSPPSCCNSVHRISSSAHRYCLKVGPYFINTELSDFTIFRTQIQEVLETIASSHRKMTSPAR